MSVRKCTVPSRTDFVIGVPAIDCSTIEKPPFHATTNAGLVTCASRGWKLNRPRNSLTVDGMRVQPASMFVLTPAFRFSVNHNQPDITGRATGTTAVAGEPAILGPLAPGRHEVIAENQYKGVPSERTTYLLTVR
jgi:hypothetical protein